MNRIVVASLLITLLVPSGTAARTPNDPSVQQWGFADVKAFEAWDVSVGSHDVVVAIIDNGFDTFHPDLRNNVWQNTKEIPNNNIDDDKNGFVDDVWGWNFVPRDSNGDGRFTEEEQQGDNNPRPDPERVSEQDKKTGAIHHGTLVAGIIGAVGNNKKHGAGINWNVKLMNLKALEEDGAGNLVPLARAIRYAADNGADVINVSLVGDPADVVYEAIKYAYKEKGVAIVAAAGNSRVAMDISPVYPVCADANESEEWVLGVSAINREHFLAPFSNVGKTCVDITAPGVDVASTLRFSPTNGFFEQYSSGWMGTSFSAPFVSGAAALIKSVQPSWKAPEIYDAILKNTHKTPPKDEEAYEIQFGAGLLQIDKAVAYAKAQKNSESLRNPMDGAVIDSVVSFVPDTGVTSERGFDSTAPAVRRLHRALQYATTAVQYVSHGKRYFLVVQKDSLVSSNVSVYTSDWQRIYTWGIDMGGALDVAISNIMGDEAPEVLFAPGYPSTELFRITTIEGKELFRKTQPTKHTGVSLAPVSKTPPRGGGDIAILVRQIQGWVVSRFDAVGTTVSETPVPQIETPGTLRVGDVDGDGFEEYVVGAAPGHEPQVAVYELNGAYHGKFLVYPSSYRSGFDLDVYDATNDGKQDILVNALEGAHAIEVWNEHGQKQKEWLPFGNEFTGRSRLLFSFTR